MKQTRYVVFIVTNSALNEKHETKNLQGNNKLARGFCISGAAMYYSKRKIAWRITNFMQSVMRSHLRFTKAPLTIVRHPCAIVHAHWWLSGW